MNHEAVLDPSTPRRGVLAHPTSSFGGRYMAARGGSDMLLSGNEVTDSVRSMAGLLGTSSSGQMIDAFGAPVKITNLCPNGGFETNLTSGANWFDNGSGATVTRDTSSYFSGVASGHSSLAAGSPGLAMGTSMTVVPGWAYTASVRVKANAPGQTCTLSWVERTAADAFVSNVNATFVSTGNWQYVTVTNTPAAGDTKARVALSGPAGITDLWVDEVQFEIGAVANPYVPTNGAIATSIIPVLDSSTGIRRSATNLFRHGQCDATTDWAVASGTSIALDANMPAPFSSQSIQVVCDGSIAQQGVGANTATGQAMAAGVLGVGQAWMRGVAGASYVTWVRIIHTDATQVQGTSTVFTGTGGWQLVPAPAAAAVAATKTGDVIQYEVRTNTARVETFWVAHAMVESGVAVVAPYVPTFGGSTATHAAGAVRGNAALLSVARGFVAARFRVGFSSSNAPTAFVTIFRWWDGSAANKMVLYYTASDSKWRFEIDQTAGNVTVASAAQTYHAGDIIELAAAWDATAQTVRLSVNGGAFSSSAWTHPLTAGSMQATFNVGNSDSNMDCDVFSFVAGLGSPADSDAPSLATATDPTTWQYATLSPTVMWSADDTATVTTSLRGRLTRANTSRQGRIWPGGSQAFPDPSFEQGVILPYWQPHAYAGSGVTPTGTRAVNGTQVHSGSFSLAIHKNTSTATSEEFGVVHAPQKGELSPGLYRVGGWFWSSVANVAQIQGNWDGVAYQQINNGSTVNAWVYKEMIVRYDGGQRTWRLFINGTLLAVDAYFDDVFMQPLAGSVRASLSRALTTRGAFAPASQPSRAIRNRARVIMEWGDDPAHRISVRWQEKYGAYELMRVATREDVVRFPAPEPKSGDDLLVFARWEAGKLGLSIGGSPFVDAPSSIVPSIAASMFELGADVRGNRQADLNYKWVALGGGQVADADAAAANAVGDSDGVYVENFPVLATVYWPANGTGFLVRGHGGTAFLRPTIHDTAGNLIAEGDEVALPAGTAAGWVELLFSNHPGGVVATAQDYELGVHVGGDTNIARAFEDNPDAPGGVTAVDSYADGAGSTLAAPTSLPGRMAIYAELFDGWVPPNELEFWYARLPWVESQVVFSETAPDPTSERRATVGWHGTSTDGERGAFAIVSADGPFTDLVGERIRVRELGVQGKSVYVYVHAIASIGQDISLPRRTFMALSQLGVDDISATVTRMT